MVLTIMYQSDTEYFKWYVLFVKPRRCAGDKGGYGADIHLKVDQRLQQTILLRHADVLR